MSKGKTSRSKVVAGSIAVISLILTAFQLWTSTRGLMTPLLQRGFHLSLVLLLVFLYFPALKSPRATLLIDIPLCIVAIACCAYLYFTFDDLIFRLGDPTGWDLIFGVALILILLEANRRVVGWPMTILAIVALGYAFFGNLIPEPLGHAGQTYDRIISQIFLTTEGIFGVPLGVAATYVFLFLLFGSFMDKCGVGALFIELAQSLAGKYRGGPAKIGVVSSAAVGMVSGSPVSDAATTGAFTIPLMIKLGYRPNLAAAIEAVAASGASLMPPVMGAGAFVMADITGIPYSKIILHAIIPALLFYAALMFMVHYEARKANMQGLPPDQIPSVKTALMKSLRLLIPIGSLVYFLAVARTSPLRAALYALFVMVGLTIIYNVLRPATRVPLKNLYEAVEETPRKVLVVTCACATAGIIIGTLGLTGLGLKMADLLISASHGSLLLALVFAMIIALILGMGLPPTACYIIMAVTVAPSLVQMGVPLLVAHFFVFIFCCYAPITPPVALAAYTTAGIAGANPMITGLEAFRLSISGYILPFIMVYENSLLGIGSWTTIITTFVMATVGVYVFSIAIVGHYQKRVSWPWRAVLVVAAFCLIYPGLITDFIGIGIFVLFLLSTRFIRKDAGAGARVIGAAP